MTGPVGHIAYLFFKAMGETLAMTTAADDKRVKVQAQRINGGKA